MIRFVRNFGIITVILILAGVIYCQFFAPDSNIQASYGHQQRAEMSLIDGDFESGLVEVQQAISYSPDDPDLFVLQGVIQESMNQSEDAQESYKTALRLYEHDDHFYNQKSVIYLMLEDPKRALTASDKALKINSESALSYLNKGHAFELSGDILKAIKNYEIADDLAQQAGNAQLQVIIRVSLSNALQSLSFVTPVETVPSETE